MPNRKINKHHSVQKVYQHLQTGHAPSRIHRKYKKIKVKGVATRFVK